MPRSRALYLPHLRTLTIPALLLTWQWVKNSWQVTFLLFINYVNFKPPVLVNGGEWYGYSSIIPRRKLVSAW